jgi:uncharacterized phage protein (TIGR01671 family)
MREIKFEYIINIDGKIHKQVLDLSHIESGDINANGVPLSKLSAYKQVIIRRQYTGLKDKNGVEVYESDLLQVNDNYFKIEFSNGCFWGIPYKCTNMITKSDKHPLGQILHYVFEDDICEVIGNIYENKELLEQ